MTRIRVACVVPWQDLSKLSFQLIRPAVLYTLQVRHTLTTPIKATHPLSPSHTLGCRACTEPPSPPRPPWVIGRRGLGPHHGRRPAPTARCHRDPRTASSGRAIEPRAAARDGEQGAGRRGDCPSVSARGHRLAGGGGGGQGGGTKISQEAEAASTQGGIIANGTGQLCWSVRGGMVSYATITHCLAFHADETVSGLPWPSYVTVTAAPHSGVTRLTLPAPSKRESQPQ